MGSLGIGFTGNEAMSSDHFFPLGSFHFVLSFEYSSRVGSSVGTLLSRSVYTPIHSIQPGNSTQNRNMTYNVIYIESNELSVTMEWRLDTIDCQTTNQV